MSFAPPRFGVIQVASYAAQAEREFDTRPAFRFDALRERDDHRGACNMPVYNYTTLDAPLIAGTLSTRAQGINDAGEIVGSLELV